MKRRHLTSGQKTAIGTDVEEMLAEEAKERQREAGKQFGRGQEKLVEKIPQAIDENKSRQQAAKIMGVSTRSVYESNDQQKRRKKIYVALHPETRQGAQGRRGSGEGEYVSKSEVSSFSEDAAKKLGVAPRTIDMTVQGIYSDFIGFFSIIPKKCNCHLFQYLLFF